MSSFLAENPIELFDRSYRIELRGILIENNLRAHFKVKRNLKPKPNTCEVSVWGLTKANRDALEMTQDDDTFDTTLKKVTFTNIRNENLVRIEAGYVTGTQQIFYGECRSANTETNGTECITKLATGDSEKQIALARISTGIGAGTTIDQAMQQIVTLLGVGEGNVATAVQSLKLSGVANMFAQGSAFYGSAFNQMDAICKAAHIEWSVQNGVLQFLNKGQALMQNAILLKTTGGVNTGLIDSPVVDKRGILKVKTLMIPTLYPGRLVSLQTKDVTGTFRVEQCEYNGDTWGKDWYVESYLSKIRTAA